MDTFPEVGHCLNSSSPDDVISKNRRVDGGHILFRTVGQKVFSQLIKVAIRKDDFINYTNLARH